METILEECGYRCHKHDLVEESLIILQTSSSLADSKALKAGGAKIDSSVEKTEVGNVSQIFASLSPLSNIIMQWHSTLACNNNLIRFPKIPKSSR